MESDRFPHIDDTFDRLSELAAGPPSSVSERRDLLRMLRDGVIKEKDGIRDAVYSDFEKADVEAELTEIATVLLELNAAIGNLASWMAPRPVRARFPFWMTKSSIIPVPRGTVLVMAPWNYPVLLSLAPVVSSIAAGNRTMLKPSERTPNTSAFLRGLIGGTVGEDWCGVIEGGIDVGEHLLTKPFDHFYFTGSPAVGRIVMHAAADHMSSVTLELGGKSPAIVDKSIDVGFAAEKIMIGKFLNAGQTCIAPDYVLAHEQVFEQVVRALAEESSSVIDPASNGSPMTGIVDQRHRDRLLALWDDARRNGAVKQDGDELDLARVSVVTGVSLASRLMQEEIFGPILPVLRFSSLDEVAGVVSGTGSPLTTYVFSRDESFVAGVRERVKTGSISHNETLLHFAHPGLPFGGFGESGHGRTHGYHGFLAFSNEVSILKQRLGRGVLPLLFPVRGAAQHRSRRWLFKYLER